MNHYNQETILTALLLKLLVLVLFSFLTMKHARDLLVVAGVMQ